MDNFGAVCWPPREHADYQRETMDAFSAWDAERRVKRLAVVIDWLDGCVWALECELRLKRAALVMEVREQRRAEYKRLQQQLDDRGF